MILLWFFHFLQISKGFPEIQWFFHDLQRDLNLNDFSRAVGTLCNPLVEWRTGYGYKISEKKLKSTKAAKFHACIKGKGSTQMISSLRSLSLQVLPPHPEHILVPFTHAFLQLQFRMQAALQPQLSIYTLLAKKVVTPRDDVSFLWLFLFHQSARSKDRLFGVI